MVGSTGGRKSGRVSSLDPEGGGLGGGLGWFGKLPSHGDFLSRGTASATGRSFQTWLQSANDRVAEARCPLPPGPIGFVYRDERGSSLLVGTLTASRDKVGRAFPLALFWELPDCDNAPIAGLPTALAPMLEEFAARSHAAAGQTPAQLAAAVDGMDPPPSPPELIARARAERQRLGATPLAPLLDRLFPPPDARHYAVDVLLRACESTRRYRSISKPLVLDNHVQSDIELMFWLACTDAALSGTIGPLAMFWDVSAARLLVVLGSPEPNSLYYLCGRGVQYQRLWPTATDNLESRQQARARLDPAHAHLLDAPELHVAEDFITGISGLPNDPP